MGPVPRRFLQIHRNWPRAWACLLRMASAMQTNDIDGFRLSALRGDIKAIDMFRTAQDRTEHKEIAFSLSAASRLRLFGDNDSFVARLLESNRQLKDIR